VVKENLGRSAVRHFKVYFRLCNLRLTKLLCFILLFYCLIHPVFLSRLIFEGVSLRILLGTMKFESVIFSFLLSSVAALDQNQDSFSAALAALYALPARKVTRIFTLTTP
jgi:hypothetical protein